MLYVACIHVTLMLKPLPLGRWLALVGGMGCKTQSTHTIVGRNRVYGVEVTIVGGVLTGGRAGSPYAYADAYYVCNISLLHRHMLIMYV